MTAATLAATAAATAAAATVAVADATGDGAAAETTEAPKKAQTGKIAVT